MPHKRLTELLRVQLTCLDQVSSRTQGEEGRGGRKVLCCSVGRLDKKREERGGREEKGKKEGRGREN